MRQCYVVRLGRSQCMPDVCAHLLNVDVILHTLYVLSSFVNADAGAQRGGSSSGDNGLLGCTVPQLCTPQCRLHIRTAWPACFPCWTPAMNDTRIPARNNEFLIRHRQMPKVMNTLP
jgi:hypothetical protein